MKYAMSEAGRTIKAKRNAYIGMLAQMINLVLGFVSRTIFVSCLNADYLGINSLYANILTVLSFAELGIGSAITFSLYKPIDDDDKNRIQALMKFYAKAYQIIGITVFAIGLCLIPFMDHVIKDAPDVKENLIVVYLLFLSNTSISYFFSYKKTLLIASQKDYVVQLYTRTFQLIQVIVQSFFLILTHNYLVHLIIQFVFTFLLNISLSVKVDHSYPFIKKKNDNELSKEDSKSIFENVKALVVYKFGSVIMNGTDNIIISLFVGIGAVGISSNYTLVMNSITDVIGQALTSVLASIGNLAVRGSKAQIKAILHQLLLLCIWLYGFVGIGFLALANDFILLWIGEEWLLSQEVVFSLVFSLYINGVQYSAYSFRTTQGLFVQSKWVPILSAIINVVLSIWWVELFGLAGVFLATGVTRLCTTTLVDPWLVYKNNFGQKPYEYYAKYIMGTMGVVVNAVIQRKIISLILLDGITGFFVKFFIICISCNVVFYIMFGWTKDAKGLFGRLLPGFVKKNK